MLLPTCRQPLEEVSGQRDLGLVLDPLNAGWRQIRLLEDLALIVEGGDDGEKPSFVRGV